MNRKNRKREYIRYKNNLRHRGMLAFEGILKSKGDYYEWMNKEYEESVKSFKS